MARVHHVKRARKDNRALGIKKGQEYWWWANRMPGSAQGVKRASLKPPKHWQTLPPGSYGSAVGELCARFDDLTPEGLVAEDSGDTPAEALKSEIEAVAEEARTLAEEQEEKRSNMPDALQDGDTGQLLEQRASDLNDYADALEAIDVDDDDVQSAIDEAQGLSVG